MGHDKSSTRCTKIKSTDLMSKPAEFCRWLNVSKMLFGIGQKVPHKLSEIGRAEKGLAKSVPYSAYHYEITIFRTLCYTFRLIASILLFHFLFRCLAPLAVHFLAILNRVRPYLYKIGFLRLQLSNCQLRLFRGFYFLFLPLS